MVLIGRNRRGAVSAHEPVFPPIRFSARLTLTPGRVITMGKEGSEEIGVGPRAELAALVRAPADVLAWLVAEVLQ